MLWSTIAKYEWIVAVGTYAEGEIGGAGLPTRITAVCRTVLTAGGIHFPSSIALIPGWSTGGIEDVSIRYLAKKLDKRVKELRRSGTLPPGKLVAVYGYFSAFDGLRAKNCNPKDCASDVLMAPAMIQVGAIQEIP